MPRGSNEQDDSEASPEAVVARVKESHDRLQRRLATLSFRWPIFALCCIVFAVVGALLGYGEFPFWSAAALPYALVGAAVGGATYWGVLQYFRLVYSTIAKSQARLLFGQGISSLQETLEEDFFTKLVKINFKYIDRYYLQTQSQADKSFTLCAWVAAIGLMVIVAGIALMYCGKTTPAYVAAASGVLGEFIAAVFFYLYNRTILKMSQYHQKLVITQNVSLALKIAEGLPEAERVKAQQELISRLTENVNKYLTETHEPTAKIEG